MANSHPLSIQIRVHHLNENENLESLLFTIKKGYIVQFKLGSTLFGQKVKLFINYPVKSTDVYNRHAYQELKWKSESTNKGDDTALYCDLIFEVAGSFHYFFIPEGGDVHKPSGSGYILVDPVLKYGSEDEILSLDSILCITYLAKSLGSFDEWENRLQTAKEVGYNMIHITPVQELGSSLSSYSLKNQLRLNPVFDYKGKKCTMDDISSLVEKIRKEWKMMTITDVVLNHTANESEWLEKYPDSTYNLMNSPHLRPAFLLDRAIWYFSLEIAAGKWNGSGIPPNVNSESHLNAIRMALNGYFMHQLKLHEFFILNIDEILNNFKAKLKDSNFKRKNCSGEINIIQDPEFRRCKSTIDMQLALSIYAPMKMSSDEEINKCCENLKTFLEVLNNAKKNEIDGHFYAAVENILSAVHYERLNPAGPLLYIVSSEYPLVPQYFLYYGKDANLEDDEKLMFSTNSCYLMAHNGWVMGDNPLKNFAELGSNVYLRRELVAWGDSVKLRYGERPEDSPFLWEHMTKYVQQLSTVFHGLRLDNCHSTPIHVAEYLIDKAREVRPDLFIIAELFTSSEGVDNIFVNRLGITALVREAMAAPDSHEQGRLVYRYGGSTVGAFIHPVTRPLTKNIAHAVFMDITHDNECPIQKRSVYDYFPTAAMVSMACCSTGSTWGYDQLVPHHIHVVSENRLYSSWTNDQNVKRGYVNEKSGIIAGKRALNKLHSELGSSGFSQVFVDQRDEHTVAITRHCPATHQSVIMIARTAFKMPLKPNESSYTKPLKIQGTVDEIILEGRLKPVNHNGTTLGPSFQKDEKFLNGLIDFELLLKENIPIYESEMIEISSHSEDGYVEIDFTCFPPGSVVIVRISLDSDSRAAILRIRSCVSQFGYRMRTYSGNVLKRGTQDFESILAHLSLADLNCVLFHCDDEEKDDGKGRGTYHLPNYGNLVYCGLQGFMSELMIIHLEDDLGHPLCQNLRDGNWLPDYIVNYLLDHPNTHDLGKWFQVVFDNLKKIPRYLIPCYFDTIITGAYSSLLTSLWRKMSDFVSEGSTFVKALALGSVILCGVIKSASLPLLSPNLNEPVPKESKDKFGNIIQDCVTISAGLPHFSTGYMRNWGRDTFISLKGLLLVTGRYDDARYLILAFAGCLRHGLIPNLLDRGACARFNCRDAVWWWLQSIQEYVKIVPNGHRILKDKVSRLFPFDNLQFQESGNFDQPLHDVMQESLQIHFQGLKFREHNAGHQLDEHMSDSGFNNEIGVDLVTGFVFGGNVHNCGTWMDKMGSSDKAGNRGKPATPRDGSAVEIIGLCKSSLRWLNEMFHQGFYPYCIVECCSTNKSGLGHTILMTFKEWGELIQKNFEKQFYIGIESSPDDSKFINKRGIYKDSVNASQPWADFQLRPNFLIAMSVAPELFSSKNAWKALSSAENHLLGPLGMKTLDPSDWAYDGNYDNSDDSMDMKRARGWNYHQGPEWLWPVGYFLRAKLIFSNLIGGREEFERTVDFTKRVMSQHFLEIQKSKWKGLPELTNKNGTYCKDSCVVQAWSHATLLDVLYEMDNLCSIKNNEI